MRADNGLIRHRLRDFRQGVHVKVVSLLEVFPRPKETLEALWLKAYDFVEEHSYHELPLLDPFK